MSDSDTFAVGAVGAVGAAGDGQTPLSPDELHGLIPGHITTRGELDRAEADNIAQALVWLARRRRSKLLSVAFAKQLHLKMYGSVWRWAGTFSREVNRTIGDDAHDIEPHLIILFDDVRYRLEQLTQGTDRVEILASFHHRLTKIHPFPNGNGRWAREMTDLLATRLGVRTIAWGRDAHTEEALHRVGDRARERYLAALRAGDGYNIEPLLTLLREWSEPVDP